MKPQPRKGVVPPVNPTSKVPDRAKADFANARRIGAINRRINRG